MPNEESREKTHFSIEFMHGHALVEIIEEGLRVHGFVESIAKLGSMKNPKPIPHHLETDIAEAIWEEGQHTGDVYFSGKPGVYVMQEDGSARYEDTDLPTGPVGLDPEDDDNDGFEEH